MKNEKERHAFIDNPENWQIAAEPAEYIRILRIEYMNEYRYALEVFQDVTKFDYELSAPVNVPEWHIVNYYKISDLFPALEQQSLTQIRNWISDLDKGVK